MEGAYLKRSENEGDVVLACLYQHGTYTHLILHTAFSLHCFFFNRHLSYLFQTSPTAYFAFISYYYSNLIKRKL